MFWKKKIDNEKIVIELLKADIAKIAESIADLKKSETSPSKIISRLEDLELWRAKLHSLMIETTPSGRDKLTKQGKFFGNRYNQSP